MSALIRVGTCKSVIASLYLILWQTGIETSEDHEAPA